MTNDRLRPLTGRTVRIHLSFVILSFVIRTSVKRVRPLFPHVSLADDLILVGRQFFEAHWAASV
jgi:hypothetical protein